MIQLVPHADGTILPVRARAGTRRNELRGEQGGHLRVSVTQAPEKGKANQAIIDVLCRELGLRSSQVELIAGGTSSRKRFLIRGLKPADLAGIIDRSLVPNK
jgi:uncharacterized protein